MRPPLARQRPSWPRGVNPGQSLVLFALFLTVLLGISALGIDYASWLLTDRKLQNLSDSAATAGASAFGVRAARGSCAVSPADAKCVQARTQAWKSLDQALALGMNDATIASVAATDRMALTSWTTGAPPVTTSFKGSTIWVTTPPPNNAAYTGLGGRYALNYGVVWVRVDTVAPSFFANIFGIGARSREGWATAGALPSGFALQTFCRNNVAPQNGVCVNSAGVTIDGQGGIHVLSGDLASNESLKITSNNGSGVVLESGDVFLVNGACASSSWNCPQTPATTGGISDADPIAFPSTANNKNAFYMAPTAVPRYESPLEFGTKSDCTTASAGNPCVPWRNQTGTDPAPNQGAWTGSWTCGTGSPGIPNCGIPSVTTTVNGPSTISCGAGAFDPNTRFLRPNTDDATSNRLHGSQFNTSGSYYQNIHDATMDPAGTLPLTDPGSAPLAPPTPPPGNPITDWVYTEDNQAVTYRVGLTPPQGVPSGTNMTVRYVLFKTVNGVYDSAAGSPVNVTISLKEKTGNGNGANAYTLRGAAQSQSATETVTVYQYPVNMATIGNFNKLYLEFTISKVSGHGAGISWAEAEIPTLLPPTPPTIKAGYWKSIVIPANACAILDPSPALGLQQYQLPGVFRFGTSGGTIDIGANAYLIGDAVTLVFDSSWPDSGINVAPDGALILNTAISGGYNPSYPLANLPRDSINSAWQVDSGIAAGTHDGWNAWPVCTSGGNDCMPRKCYMNTDPNLLGCEGDVIAPGINGRGISFYFTPAAWPPSGIRGRFGLGGGSGTQPGLAYRGVLYAPYDDVKVSGGNGFNTVGQILAWTVKFNGGSAFVNLEYPYTAAEADPYLLEPTVR